ncbi:MAG TPA: hypothetical protein PLQ13_02080 [Candidatus Krumholzibacteria bacterium]|nr:hypothetical protein [Candidatus Krumholzibacteria bacterium]
MMRRLLLSTLVVVSLLAVGGTAMATEFTDVIFAGGCTDWTAELGVHFRIGMTEANIDYAVAILDQDGTTVLSSTGTGVVTDDDGDRYGTLLLGQSWDDVTDQTIELYGMYTIRGTFTLYVPWLDEVHTYVVNQDVTLECAVVPNEDVSWGDVKSTYR